MENGGFKNSQDAKTFIIEHWNEIDQFTIPILKHNDLEPVMNIGFDDVKKTDDKYIFKKSLRFSSIITGESSFSLFKIPTR